MKKVIAGLVLLVIILSSCEEDKNYNLQEGLVAYYPFNGNANDESSNFYNGIISGASLIQDRLGNDNSALRFNGIDNSVTCGSSNRGITNSLTVSVWVKTTTENGTVVAKYDAKNDKGWFIKFTEGGKVGLYGRNTANDFARAETTTSFNDNTWHHLLGTINLNTFKLYVDGTLVGEDVLEAEVPDITCDDDLGIGYWALGDLDEHYYCAADIDDIAIYNRILTNKEMKVIRTKGI